MYMVQTDDPGSIARTLGGGSKTTRGTGGARSRPTCGIERAERREGGVVKELKEALASFRTVTHGKVRTNNMLKAGGAKARAHGT